MKVMSNDQALKMGYSADKRKRRRQHRQNARDVLGQGGVFVGIPPQRGSTLYAVAQWNLYQARWLGR